VSDSEEMACMKFLLLMSQNTQITLVKQSDEKALNTKPLSYTLLVLKDLQLTETVLILFPENLPGALLAGTERGMWGVRSAGRHTTSLFLRMEIRLIRSELRW